jgi:hypothetical protein
MKTELNLDAAGVAVPARSRVSFWVNAVAVLGSLLLAAGAAVAYFKPGMLLGPHDQISEGVRVYAGYLISRNAALALLLLGAVLLRARTVLASMLLLVGVVQMFDAFIDAGEGRWTLVPGVAVLGILVLLAAVSARPARLSRG